MKAKVASIEITSRATYHQILLLLLRTAVQKDQQWQEKIKMRMDGQVDDTEKLVLLHGHFESLTIMAFLSKSSCKLVARL